MRKWRENEEMKKRIRKWRESEEMEREGGNGHYFNLVCFFLLADSIQGDSQECRKNLKIGIMRK